MRNSKSTNNKKAANGKVHHHNHQENHPKENNNNTNVNANSGGAAPKVNPTPKVNSSPKANPATKGNPICNICAQNVPGPERENIFALGKCDHHVCYVCSARLRAICDQLECPICREKLDNVIFSSNRSKLFEKYDLKSLLYNEKYKIYFENESIKNAFEQLLEFDCLECVRANNNNNNSNKQQQQQADKKSEFSDVYQLKMHLANEHKLKLCDLCLKHNKLFPFEFSYYDANKLKMHMREGEQNTSHRGHPNCVLCHSTFFNTDELLQHMSREHFHCHLCGRCDSNMRIYFLDYESLRQHFKSRHYLCERGNCRHEQFTSAFDSQIDYQLHTVQVHGGSTANLSRSEARQQRTITLESAPHRLAPQARQPNLPRNAAIVSTGNIATANNPRQQVPESMQAQVRQQRLPSRADFPALGQQYSMMGSSTSAPQQTASSQMSQVNQYPSLASAHPDRSSRPTLNPRLIAGTSNTRGSFLRYAGASNRPPESLSEMEFPPLPEQPKPKSKKGPGKNKAQPKPAIRNQGDGLTLEQLISSSLSLSSRGNKSLKTNRNSKPKALKIQL